jgi:RNA polymerase sigma-70 factor (ECF subfamily)
VTHRAERAAAPGDPERFDVLYRQYFRAVLGYALARLDAERAGDVAAETFLVAWRRLSDVPDDPLPWLYGVARKVTAGQLRGDRRREALQARIAARDPLPGLHADPADVIARREAALAALDTLSEADREVLTLIAWHGLDGRQAGEALGISRLSFAVRLHRARSRLSAALAKADNNAPAQAISSPAATQLVSPTRSASISRAREARR